MAWNYKREEKTFKPLEIGDYRIRIKSAEKAVSSKGNDMIRVQFNVSGSNSIIYHNFVFLPDRPEITNSNLTKFFDSFKDIKEGEITNLDAWIGKVGACHIKHEEYNGNINAKVHYFIAKEKQGALPPWKEPDGDSAKTQADENGFMNIPDNVGEELPF